MTRVPEEIAISMITVDRQPAYVHTTLASLFASDPWVHRVHGVELYVGSNEAAYLDPYRHHARLTIHGMSEEQWNSIREMSIWKRLCYNYRRALQAPPPAKGLLVLEDDVVLQNDFLQILLGTVNEIESSLGAEAKYMLAGYCPYDFRGVSSLACGERYVAYPWREFYGTQCIYYPRQVAADLVGCFTAYGFGTNCLPADMIVKKYGSELPGQGGRQGGIYACTRSLAQHTGRQTTGVGGFHRSPTF